MKNRSLIAVMVCLILAGIPSMNHLESRSQKPKAPLSKACKTMLKKRGGVLYDEYVTAIHTRRYRSEFTPAQWKTILLQKRVRVPFTAIEHTSMLELFINESQ